MPATRARRTALAVLAGLAAALGAIDTADAAPIRPRVAGCRPIDYLDWNDVRANGSGNVPLRRSVSFYYDLFTRPEDDGHARDNGVVPATHRIEVCIAQGGTIRCPGQGTTDEPWVLFDDSVTPPVLRLATNPPVETLADLEDRLLPSTGSGARFYTELLPVDPRNDWDDPATAGTYYVLRVNEEPLYPATKPDGVFAPDLVVEGGFCVLPRRLAASADGHFLGYGVEAQPPWPFPAAMPLVCRDPKAPTSCVPQDACVDGAKAIGPGGAPFHARSHCTLAAHAQFMVDRASEIDRWQREVATVRAPADPPAWTNGTDPGACPRPSPDGHCPSRIFIAPIEAGGQGTNGGIAMNTSVFPAHPIALLSGDAGGLVSLTSHELAHKLQDAYIRQAKAERDVDPPGLHLPSVAESVPTAIQSHFCVPGYGGVTTRACVSPGMLGQSGSAGHVWLDAPSSNVLDLPYTSAVAWRYAMEQFAIPIEPGARSPHPGGKASLVPSARALPLGHPDRRSDEGTDLLGVLVSAIATRTDALVFEETMNDVLVEYLGRDLENVVLDLHTTMLLKDYREVDPRWTIDWVGDMNAGAKAPLIPGAPAPLPRMAERKPFPVPPDLRGSGPDHLPRARRELDSFERCTGDAKRCPTARPRLLPATGGFANGPPVVLHGYGASFLSVSPAPGVAGVTVRVTPNGDAPLRVRVFTVDAAGTPTLLPSCRESLAGPLPRPQEECRPLATGEYVIDVPVKGAAETEILAIVSNTRPTDASFGWRVGQALATATLLGPTRAAPADVGHPTSARRPFRVELAIRDERNEPARLRPDSVRVAIPGCGRGTSTSSGCDLPQGAFRTAEISRGTVWIVGTLPDSLYGKPDGTMDLEVRLETQAGTPLRVVAEGALTARSSAPKTVAQLVLDRSGSMDDGDGAKLLATKLGARAVLDGLRDGDELGLVTFNHDAQTIFPVRTIDAASRGEMARAIDGVRALGWTSIGDGALEASSGLVAAGYDERRGNDPALAMLVLSDGRENAGYEIERYTLYPPYAGYTDGTRLPPGAFDLEDLGPDNDAWQTGSSGLLGWTQRAHFRGPTGATYLVPRVSTVAVGLDADAAPLRTAADICGGGFSYADGLSTKDALPRTAASVADALLGAMASATQRDRLLARTTGALTELPAIDVPPGAEARVTVVSTELRLDHLALAPDVGARIAPVRRGEGYVVFEVGSGAGTRLRLTSSDEGRGVAFVEVTARTSLSMFARVDVDDVPPPPTDGVSPYDPGRFAGKPVHVSAALHDAASARPVLGATVTATVRGPDGRERDLTLADDGSHDDGAPGDGVYAATLDATREPGVYAVALRARGTSPSELPFTREAHLAIALLAPPDRDRDGLPDAWELRHGTDPKRADAHEDPDADGLDNAAELAAGTAPLRSDSDGGGESDGSEVAAGRSPSDGSDDEVGAWGARVVPGRAHVRVGFPRRATKDAAIEVRRAPAPDRAFARVPCARADGADGSVAVRCDAREGERACWSARLVTGGPAARVAGAWSSPTCTTPRADADAPRVLDVGLLGGPWPKSRDVTLRLEATDVPHGADPLRDRNAERSGLAAIRVDVAGRPGAWQPFRRELRVRLGPGDEPAVRVLVRDAAGNVSVPVERSFRVAPRR